MSMIERVIAKAKSDVKTIVFPEGNEERTILAAEILKKEGIAKPILLGDPEDVLGTASKLGADLAGIMIEDPLSGSRCAAYADALFEIRKNKGVTLDEAEKLVLDPMYYGIMMVKMGDADGLVSGAVHTTGDMLRPALQIIKTKPEMKIVSSSFLMDCPDKSLGEDGLLVYADCVVMPCNTAHYFLPRLQAETALPILDMPAITAARCAEKYPGQRACVLATRGTLASGLYDEALSAQRVPFLLPDEAERDLLMHLIYDVVKASKPVEPERENWTRLLDGLRQKGADFFILGCTELPILSGILAVPGPFIDPSRELARAAVRFCGYDTIDE